MGALCEEIPRSEKKLAAALVWISTLGLWQRVGGVRAPAARMNFIRSDEYMRSRRLRPNVTVVLSGMRSTDTDISIQAWHLYLHAAFARWRTFCDISISSLISFSARRCSTVDALRWLQWREGHHFLVVYTLRWCTGYEATHRDSNSLYVVHTLLNGKEIASRFFHDQKVIHKSWADPRLHCGVAENKSMFTVTVNVQTGRGRNDCFWPRKSSRNEALN